MILVVSEQLFVIGMVTFFLPVLLIHKSGQQAKYCHALSFVGAPSSVSSFLSSTAENPSKLFVVAIEQLSLCPSVIDSSY